LIASKGGLSDRFRSGSGMESKQRVSTVSATVLIADDHGAPKPIMAPQVMAALFFPELLGCAHAPERRRCMVSDGASRKRSSIKADEVIAATGLMCLRPSR
jgi:hypothetical protein